MALLEKDHIGTYEKYIRQALHRHGLKKATITAHAFATVSPNLYNLLAHGPLSGLFIVSCLLATTKQELLIIFTKQIGIETPTVVQSFVFPLRAVQLVKARRGWLLNHLSIAIEGQTIPFRLTKLSPWNNFAELSQLLSKKGRPSRRPAKPQP